MKNKHLTYPPKPWDYNPSKWSQRIAISLIATVPFFIAVYMGLFQWGLISQVWDPIFGQGSENVLSSDVSHKMSSWITIPDSILGALAYLGDIIFAMAGSTRRWQYRPWLVVLFGIDVIPLGIVSAVLVILQGAVVGYWCFLCLVTAVFSLVLVVMAYDEVWSCILFLRKVWKMSRDKKILWKTIWGFPSQVAYEAGQYITRKREDVGKNH